MRIFGHIYEIEKSCENLNERKTTSHSFGASCYILFKNVDDIWFNFKTKFIVIICVFKMQFVLHTYVALDFNIEKWYFSDFLIF
jgi:hypothetical protein